MTNNNCAGFSCFPSIREKTDQLEQYDTVKLVGFDSCGGCGRNKADKIVSRAMRLKEKGATYPSALDCCQAALLRK